MEWLVERVLWGFAMVMFFTGCVFLGIGLREVYRKHGVWKGR